MVVAGNCFRQRVTVEAGDLIRFKWVSRSGDVKFGVNFYPETPGSNAKHQGSLDFGGKDEVPLPGATGPKCVVVALGKVAGSDTHFVLSEVTAPASGSFVATWDNSAGWHQRTVLHRWDVIVGGHPAVLCADDTGEGSNDIAAVLAKDRERSAAASTDSS